MQAGMGVQEDNQRTKNKVRFPVNYYKLVLILSLYYNILGSFIICA
jgi:hypothetical protein